MSEERRFGIALLGFSKKKVNSFVEGIIKEYRDEIRDKNNEIIKLKSQIRDLHQEAGLISDLKTQIQEAAQKNHLLEEQLLEEKQLSSSLTQQVAEANEKIGIYESEAALFREHITAAEGKISAMEQDAYRKELDLQNTLEQLNSDRIKVTEALVFAHEKGESMINEAKSKTNEEMARRKTLLEQHKIKYLEFIDFIKTFRQQTAATFESLDECIGELVDNQEYEGSTLDIDNDEEKSNVSYPSFTKPSSM